MGALEVASWVPRQAKTVGTRLQIYVVFTGDRETRHGLEYAANLASGLDAQLTLVAPVVVPYPLPMERPDVPVAVTERTAEDLGRDCGLDLTVRVLLCRDKERTVDEWLPADGLVVVARRRRWGPGSYSKMIRAIQKLHRNVMVVSQ